MPTHFKISQRIRKVVKKITKRTMPWWIMLSTIFFQKEWYFVFFQSCLGWYWCLHLAWLEVLVCLLWGCFGLFFVPFCFFLFPFLASSSWQASCVFYRALSFLIKSTLLLRTKSHDPPSLSCYKNTRIQYILNQLYHAKKEEDGDDKIKIT